MSDEHEFGCPCDRCTGVESAGWAEWDHHGGDETVFAVNTARAAARVTGLVEQLRGLQHELDMTVGIWRVGGGSWQQIADARSNGEPGTAGSKDRFGATKQAAAQRFRRGAEQAAALLDDARLDDDGDGARAEFLRLARAVDARPRQYRYEVHRTRAGKGEAISSHRSLGVALDRAQLVADDDGSPMFVLRLDPRPNARPECVAEVDPS